MVHGGNQRDTARQCSPAHHGGGSLGAAICFGALDIPARRLRLT
jgi:hypothetical protein